MVNQMELFKANKVRTGTNGASYVPVKEKSAEDKELSYLSDLEKAEYLWDMRAWKQYKDQAEVETYVNEPTNKNNGHSMWCVERLKELGVVKNKIIQAIMKNPHIQYKNRLVACMIGETCPKFEKFKSYSECDCEKCQ